VQGVVVWYNIQHVSTDRASACNLYTYLTIDDKSFVRMNRTLCEYSVRVSIYDLCATDRRGWAAVGVSLGWLEGGEGETETRVRDKWKRATRRKKNHPKYAFGVWWGGGPMCQVRSVHTHRHTYTHECILYVNRVM